jgi:hypothetical protein
VAVDPVAVDLVAVDLVAADPVADLAGDSLEALAVADDATSAALVGLAAVAISGVVAAADLAAVVAAVVEWRWTPLSPSSGNWSKSPRKLLQRSLRRSLHQSRSIGETKRVVHEGSRRCTKKKSNQFVSCPAMKMGLTVMETKLLQSPRQPSPLFSSSCPFVDSSFVLEHLELIAFKAEFARRLVNRNFVFARPASGAAVFLGRLQTREHPFER